VINERKIGSSKTRHDHVQKHRISLHLKCKLNAFTIDS
jgi:hypothetical protein